MKLKIRKTNQKGAIFALALIALTSVLVLTVILVSISSTYKQSSRYSMNNLEATNLAEAGIDKAIASLNKSGGSYSGEAEGILGGGSYSVKVTDVDQNTKKVEATGYVPSKADPKSKSTATVLMQKGAGIAFSYGIQAGDGGFEINGGSRVVGSVYSNNDINLSGGGVITGDAYVAAGTSPTADVQRECQSPNCADYIFGKSVTGENRIDVAQSFKPTTTNTINKIALKLKKNGSPPNVLVRIMEDSSGKPNKNRVLTSGTLSANLVTNQYGFVDIGLVSNPSLISGTTYWIMVDNTLDNNNYWTWSRDSLGTYTQGSPAYTADWTAGNPTWTAIGGDLDFRTYMGGDVNKIAGEGSSNINGNAYANTLTGDNPSALMISKDAYYQTQNSIMASGQNCNGNNSHCHPGSTDPPPLNFPISQANIDEWKGMADDSIVNGNVNIQWPCTTTLQKKKYVGNVTVQGGCNIQIESPVWITGNLVVTGGSTVRLNSSFGPASGVVVVDGTVNLNGGSKFLGSGQAGSYLTAISTFNNQVNPAITVSGGNSSSIVYAPYGVIDLQGGTNLREATAWKIKLSGGAIVTYETGVANPFFSSGPQGSFSVINGTYQVK